MEQAPQAAELDWLQNRYATLVDNVATVVRGKRSVIELAVSCLLAEGHLLLEDVPGVGKTVLAKSLAASCAARHARLQFTPDLLPADVFGTTVFDQSRGRFKFHEGPVFANIVHVDEINRASPKTQSALLEVMEERQVSVDGTPRPVPRPFMVIATQNPVEYAGTYPLPEAQVDRFMARTELGYPSQAAEVDILALRTGQGRERQPEAVLGLDELTLMIRLVRRIHLSGAVRDYVVRLVSATRQLPDVSLGCSPRASVALAQLCQVRAAIEGRAFVIIHDVKTLARPVLAHRLLLRPEAQLDGVSPQSLLAGVVSRIEVPVARMDS